MPWRPAPRIEHKLEDADVVWGKGRKTHNYTVFPGKSPELAKARDEIPPCSNIARHKDSPSQDGEGVHGTVGSRGGVASPQGYGCGIVVARAVGRMSVGLIRSGADLVIALCRLRYYSCPW